MEICANCAAKLDPSWKFCITCGTPVPAGAAHRTRDEPIAAEAAASGAAPSVVPAEDASDDAGVEVDASATDAVDVEFVDDDALEAENETDAEFTDDEPIVEDLVADDDPIVEDVVADEPAPSVAAVAEPTTRTPRRGRSPFAPPTPAVVEDESADDEPIAREPVLPVPVIPMPDLAVSANDSGDESDTDLEPDQELEPALVHSPSINDLAREQFDDAENPFSHDLPPRPLPPQSRAEAKAAAAERAAIRARTTAAAKAEIRAKYPIGAASGRSQEYTEESIPAFRTGDGAPSKRKIDVPLVVSISLSTAGVVLIVYLAILVFGARG